MNHNSKIIRAIAAWQNDTSIHPLTCGNDSRHGHLYGVEEEGRVVLRCPDCDYRQDWIPGIVMSHHEARQRNHL